MSDVSCECSSGVISTMNSVFVSEEISNQWADKSPLNPPVVGHASRHGWENHGVANYKKVFGEADYAKYTQSDLPIPMPTKSVALKKELDRRVFRCAWNLAPKHL